MEGGSAPVVDFARAGTRNRHEVGGRLASRHREEGGHHCLHEAVIECSHLVAIGAGPVGSERRLFLRPKLHPRLLVAGREVR